MTTSAVFADNAFRLQCRDLWLPADIAPADDSRLSFSWAFEFVSCIIAFISAAFIAWLVVLKARDDIWRRVSIYFSRVSLVDDVQRTSVVTCILWLHRYRYATVGLSIWSCKRAISARIGYDRRRIMAFISEGRCRYSLSRCRFWFLVFKSVFKSVRYLVSFQNIAMSVRFSSFYDNPIGLVFKREIRVFSIACGVLYADTVTE